MDELPYYALLRGRRYPVRVALAHEDGRYTLELDERRWPVDDPRDLLEAAAPGEEVTAEYEQFSLSMTRNEAGEVLFRASARGVTGPVERDDERACWGLLDALGDANAPRACFFCRWSEVEPSSGWGHLGCAVAYAETYDSIATSPAPRRRKYGPSGMLTWVSEGYGCARFEVRPVGYGYRGRPAVKP